MIIVVLLHQLLNDIKEKQTIYVGLLRMGFTILLHQAANYWVIACRGADFVGLISRQIDCKCYLKSKLSLQRYMADPMVRGALAALYTGDRIGV
jgi:hypothetical protein